MFQMIEVSSYLLETGKFVIKLAICPSLHYLHYTDTFLCKHNHLILVKIFMYHVQIICQMLETQKCQVHENLYFFFISNLVELQCPTQAKRHDKVGGRKTSNLYHDFVSFTLCQNPKEVLQFLEFSILEGKKWTEQSMTGDQYLITACNSL